MPDAVPPQNASTGAVEGNPDRVGEELADDARIWRVYDRIAKEDDDRRVAHWNRGLDNLALFAGLFSAVTTAFIIEAQKDMKPDYTQLTFLVLNATAFNRPFVPELFGVPATARTINSLWISSLVLSLSAALIAIMGKDWIGMYTSRPVCNPRQWAEMRTYRLRCVERWYMSGVISAAPVLLHVSLLLFGAGLVLFVSANSLVHRLTLGLCLAAGLLYFLTAFSAIVFSASPFKSPATQMIRAAITSFFFFLAVTFSGQKRNLLASVQQAINDLVAPGLQVASSQSPTRSLWDAICRTSGDARFPDPEGVPPTEFRQATLPRLLEIAAAITRGTLGAHRTVVHEPHYLRQRLRGKLSWTSLLCWYRNTPIRIGEMFSATTWTDLPAHRRPDLIADSLAWLIGASQAPDVFRALVFALGDLEIGGQVGLLVPRDLLTRVRTEIRSNWMKVDYLMFSRYVLADRNLPGNYVLDEPCLESRFDVTAHPTLRCEDGLAAFVRLNGSYIWPRALADHFSGHVTQPRMTELLLPHIGLSIFPPVEAVILMANHNWGHICHSFRLEVELYRHLRPLQRNEYASMVADGYGTRTGPIEILSFLCYQGRMHAVTERAAVELMLRILDSEPGSDHPCLAYPFSREHLWWDGTGARIRPHAICSSLLRSLHYTHTVDLELPSEAHRHAFELALTRTMVMMLSPFHTFDDAGHSSSFSTVEVSLLVSFLSVQLCNDRSLLYDNEKLDIIRIVLKECALVRVASPRGFYADVQTCGITILEAIVRRIRCLLCDTKTCVEGQRLFEQLAFAEITDSSTGHTASWDFREWVSFRTQTYLSRYASLATAMQDLHNAMTELYPLCADNVVLSAHWERIGYPGRPGDVFSDPFLSLGAFFEIEALPDPPDLIPVSQSL